MSKIIPKGYTNNGTALVVEVKINNYLKVKCICDFVTETAYICKYRKGFINSIHRPIVEELLENFGFTLVRGNDTKSYEAYWYIMEYLSRVQCNGLHATLSLWQLGFESPTLGLNRLSRSYLRAFDKF